MNNIVLCISSNCYRIRVRDDKSYGCVVFLCFGPLLTPRYIFFRYTLRCCSPSRTCCDDGIESLFNRVIYRYGCCEITSWSWSLKISTIKRRATPSLPWSSWSSSLNTTRLEHTQHIPIRNCIHTIIIPSRESSYILW